MLYAIDCETSGLKHAHGDKAFCVAYTDENGKAIACYIGTDSFTHLKELLDNEHNEWVGHNIGFDLPFLHDLGLIPKGRIHDTMIMAHVYNNIEPHKDLATLAEKYCKIPNTEDVALETWFKENRYNKDNRKYQDVPREVMEPYAKADVTRTLALYNFYKDKGLIEDNAYLAEMRVLPVVSKIEARGMCVDLNYAKEEMDKATTILAKIENDVLRKYGINNIESTAEIADVLFTFSGLICTTFTEKGNICLDETAIKKYDHPLVKLVLQHRELNKLVRTYLTAIIDKSHEGRLHSSLKQVGARTARFASSQPNIQNIPRTDEHSPINLRRAFVCAPESSILLIDLSQIELRILAHYSKEPVMIKTLTERKGDLHTATSIAMFGEVNNDLRTVAKTLNFAVIYGAGSEALVEQLNKALPNKQVTLSQAKEFKQKFFKGYPLVQQFLWDVQTRISERGYVLGKSGRKYYCEKDKAYRASNYLIQGEAAMLMKDMMVGVEEFLSDKMSQLVNVIHDEFIIELHDKDSDIINDIVSVIERSDGWRVPIYANASISHTNWAEKKAV